MFYLLKYMWLFPFYSMCFNTKTKSIKAKLVDNCKRKRLCLFSDSLLQHLHASLGVNVFRKTLAISHQLLQAGFVFQSKVLLTLIQCFPAQSIGKEELSRSYKNTSDKNEKASKITSSHFQIVIQLWECLIFILKILSRQ